MWSLGLQALENFGDLSHVPNNWKFPCPTHNQKFSLGFCHEASSSIVVEPHLTPVVSALDFEWLPTQLQIISSWLWSICKWWVSSFLCEIWSHTQWISCCLSVCQLSWSWSFFSCGWSCVRAPWKREEWKMAERKWWAVKKIAPPTDIDSLKRFLEMTSYYRCFIKKCAHIAEPLTRLLGKGNLFKWNSDCTYAFETLKQRLTEAPIPAYPRFNHPC